MIVPDNLPIRQSLNHLCRLDTLGHQGRQGADRYEVSMRQTKTLNKVVQLVRERRAPRAARQYLVKCGSITTSGLVPEMDNKSTHE